jgi:hypothetical protein
VFTDKDISDFVDGQKTKNTVSYILSDVGIFMPWLIESEGYVIKIYNKQVILHLTSQYGIYLDSYTA